MGLCERRHAQGNVSADLNSYVARKVVVDKPVVKRANIWHGPSPTDELWLARRLGIPHAVLGSTGGESRREEFRKAILERGLADQPAGQRDGVPETYRILWSQWYGEDL